MQSDPVEIVILPSLSATTEGGGSVAVERANGTPAYRLDAARRGP